MKEFGINFIGRWVILLAIFLVIFPAIAVTVTVALSFIAWDMSLLNAIVRNFEEIFRIYIVISRFVIVATAVMSLVWSFFIMVTVL